MIQPLLNILAFARRCTSALVAFALACAVLFALPGCGEVDARIALAQQFSADGDFDQAFEAYERLYQTGVRDPRVLAGLGLVLTLQPVSLFAGMDMMERSLAERSDEGVREQLMLMYLAMERVDLARDLIHPDRLSVEQVYSPGITRMRLGLSCLDRPGPRSIKRLAELPAHPRRDFFEILCGFAWAERSPRARGVKSVSELIADWRAFRAREPRAACEVVAVLPGPSAGEPGRESEAESNADFPEAERRACRTEFPGEISIQRERPADSIRAAPGSESAAATGDPARSNRSLFDVDLFQPDDPGAELEKPAYRRPPASEPATGDGPYLPLP